MKIWNEAKWENVEDSHDFFGTPAFQFGYGLFETILIKHGRPVDLEEHLERLARSITQLENLPYCPLDMPQLQARVVSSLRQCKVEKEVLKIVAYQDGEEWKSLLLMRPYIYTRDDYARGFSLKKSAVLRNADSLLVYHKTLNYLENYLERRRARHMGYDETFFFNREGVVTECTAANIFIVSKGKLLTSPVQAGLLPGITRGKLLKIAKTLGLVAEEVSLSLQMLRAADLVLLTNALYGAMPVSCIDTQRYQVDLALVDQINKALGRA